MGGSVVGEGVKMWGSETPPYLPGADRHKRESRRSAQGADLTPHPPFLLGLRGVGMLVRFEGGGSHLDVGETCSVLLRFFPPSPYTYNVRPALVWVWRSGGRCGVVGLVWGEGCISLSRSSCLTSAKCRILRLSGSVVGRGVEAGVGVSRDCFEMVGVCVAPGGGGGRPVGGGGSGGV
jgi:hypothetical protein